MQLLLTSQSIGAGDIVCVRSL